MSMDPLSAWKLGIEYCEIFGSGGGSATGFAVFGGAAGGTAAADKSGGGVATAGATCAKAGWLNARSGATQSVPARTARSATPRMGRNDLITAAMVNRTG